MMISRRNVQEDKDRDSAVKTRESLFKKTLLGSFFLLSLAINFLTMKKEFSVVQDSSTSAPNTFKELTHCQLYSNRLNVIITCG